MLPVPNVIKRVEKKLEVGKDVKLSNNLASNVLECELHSFKPSLEMKEVEAFVYLDKNDMIFKIVCDRCLKFLMGQGLVLYYDSLEMFRKRRKTGMIAQLYQELLSTTTGS